MSGSTGAETRSRRTATIAQVRAGGQPPGLMDRRNEEHWAGRLYMRKLSPFFSWVFLKIGFSPNQLTYLMIICGVLSGVVVAMADTGTAGLYTALGGVLLIQAYLLLDCSDGEVARFTGQTSVAGVYLDRIGHYLSEVALLVGLGIRAQGATLKPGGWAELGLIAALGAALIKAETDNVVVARAKAGLAASPESGDRALRPRSTGLALARQAASMLRFHRIIGAVELSLLIGAAALIDHFLLNDPGGPGGAAAGDWTATRVLLVLVAAVAVLQTLLHLISIVASRRLS